MGGTLKGLRAIALVAGLALPTLVWADPGAGSAPSATPPRGARQAARLERTLDQVGDVREGILQHTYLDRTPGVDTLEPRAERPTRLASLKAKLDRDGDRSDDAREARLATLTFSRRHAVLARLRDFGGDNDEYWVWRWDLVKFGPSRANPNMVDRIVEQKISEGLQRRADEAEDQRETEAEEQSLQRDEAQDERDLERDLQQDDRHLDRTEDRTDEEATDDGMEGDERAEERELERTEEAEAERTIQAEEDGSTQE